MRIHNPASTLSSSSINISLVCSGSRAHQRQVLCPREGGGEGQEGGRHLRGQEGGVQAIRGEEEGSGRGGQAGICCHWPLRPLFVFLLFLSFLAAFIFIYSVCSYQPVLRIRCVYPGSRVKKIPHKVIKVFFSSKRFLSSRKIYL